jgi:hypothetical protein
MLVSLAIGWANEAPMDSATKAADKLIILRM